MRGKCDTCEFFQKLLDGGTCHIRSVASDDWPLRQESSGCGEYEPEPAPMNPPEDLPEVHTGTRVEKSMGEARNMALESYPCPDCGHLQKFTEGPVTRKCAGCEAQIKWFCDMRSGYDRVFGWRSLHDPA